MKTVRNMVLASVVFIVTFLPTDAQEYNQKEEMVDSTQLMSSVFYSSSDFTLHDFEYERNNKALKYQLRANDIRTLGFFTCLLLEGIFICVCENNNVTLWVTIPCGTVLGCGVVAGTVYWSKHVEERADTISVAKVAVYDLGHNLSMGVVAYKNHLASANNGCGINLTLAF